MEKVEKNPAGFSVLILICLSSAVGVMCVCMGILFPLWLGWLVQGVVTTGAFELQN